MFYCMNCGASFESPANGSSGVSGEAWEVCPVCGHDDVEEASQCAVCGEWKPESDMQVKNCCKSCCDDAMTVVLAQMYIEENDLQREYYVEWFNNSKCEKASQQLIDSCKNVWNYSICAKKDMLDYIEENRNDFAEWLGKQVQR